MHGVGGLAPLAQQPPEAEPQPVPRKRKRPAMSAQTWGVGGWVALWRPSRTPPKRGRLPQSAEWGGAGVDYSPIPL